MGRESRRGVVTSRTLTIHKPERFVPWRAVPDPATTVEELQAAVDRLPVKVVTEAEFGVILMMANASDVPPTIEVLADTMFGADANPILVEETGVHRTPDLFNQEARDRHAEQDSEQ